MYSLRAIFHETQSRFDKYFFLQLGKYNTLQRGAILLCIYYKIYSNLK